MEKKSTEAKRLFFHVTPAVIAIICVQIIGFDRLVVWSLLAVVAATILSLDCIRFICYRISQKTKNLDTPFWRWFLHKEQWLVDSHILRHEERVSPSSMMTFSIGLVVTYFFFPEYIALPALIVLSLGDPAARIFGINSKGYRFSNGKSLAGTTGFVAVSIIGLMIFNFLHIWWPMYPRCFSSEQIVFAQSFGVVSGAGIELVFRRLDNMLIAIATAIAMSLFL